MARGYKVDGFKKKCFYKLCRLDVLFRFFTAELFRLRGWFCGAPFSCLHRIRYWECMWCCWQQYVELSAKKIRQALKHAVVQRDVVRIEAELREKETGLQNLRVKYFNMRC